MPDFICIPPGQGEGVTVEEVPFQFIERIRKHFEFLACSVPVMGRTELPAASEDLPEGGKLQGDKKVRAPFNSYLHSIF